MGLIEKIAAIDRQFAKELESLESAYHLLKYSPWAWFSSELYAGLPQFEQGTAGLPTIWAIELFKTTFGYAKPEKPLSYLAEHGNASLRIMKTSKLVYLEEEQLIRRFLIEYCCLGSKNLEWVKFILYLCRENRGCTLIEIAKGLKVNRIISSNITSNYPKIFHKNVSISDLDGKKGRGSTNTYQVNKEFYQKIYLPISPWLSAKGCETFNVWKKAFHASKKS